MSIFILLPVVLFINLFHFAVSCLVLEIDFCFLFNIIALNGALNVVLTALKNTFEKLNSLVNHDPDDTRQSIDLVVIM